MIELVNSIKNKAGEECMICHFPVESDNMIVLKCKHTYHNDCVNYLFKYNTIICPYCQTSCQISHSTKSDIIVNKSITVPIFNKCEKIIKTGTKKGTVCNKINCKRHNKITQVVCSAILKTGVKKGTICNKINCKRHNIIV